MPTGNTQQVINYGASANDGQGDPLRTAFIKTDENFDNIWLAGPAGSNVRINNNTISVIDTNGNLVLSPNGTGVIQTNNKLVPRLDRTYDIGSSDLKYRNIYANTFVGNATLGNASSISIDVNDLRISGGTNGYVLQTDGVGNLTWTAQTGGSGNGTPGGANTQIQYNNAGNFDGAAGFTFNNVTGNFAIPGRILTLVSTAANANAVGNTGISVYRANANIIYNQSEATWTFNKHVKIQPDSGSNIWWFGNTASNDTLVFPSGAFWTSNAVAKDEYIGSAANGYLNLDTYNASGNWAARLHMEHELVHVTVAGNTGGNTSSQWTFNSDGTLNFPSGATWSSNAVSGDDYITSAANGYLNLQTYNAGNLASQIHMEHGVLQLSVFNGAEQQWSFSDDGNLTLPGNTSSINYANGSPYGGDSTGNLEITGTLIEIAAGATETSIVISPSGPTGGQAFVDVPDNATANTANLRIYNSLGNIELGTDDGNNVWSFDNTGNLNLPSNGDINFNGGSIAQTLNEDIYIRASDDESDGWSVYTVVDDGAGNILSQTRLEFDQYTIRTDAQGAAYTWAFRDTGVLELPGDIYGNVGGNLTIKIGDQAGSNTFIDLQTRSYTGDALISNIRIANPDVTISTASAAYNWIFDGTNGFLTFPRDASNVSTDPYLVIEGGGTPSIQVVDASESGPGNLDIVSNYAKFSGYNGNTVSIYADEGQISSSYNLLLQTPSGIPNSTANINSQGGYNIGSYTGLATTGGSGTGLTVNASTAGNGYINTVTINNPGSGYTNGDTITIVGGDGLGCTFTVGVSANNWTFTTTGNLNLPIGGKVVGQTADNNGYITWLGNSSGDLNGYTTMRLVPDDTREGSDQYLIVDPTAPGHIHIRAGGTQDNSGADLFLGGENSYFRVASGANSAASVSANSYVWTYGTDGTFSLPAAESPGQYSEITSVGNSSGDGYGYATLQLKPDTSLSGDSYLIIDPTAPNHIHIRAGGAQDNSGAQLFLGGENSYFLVENGANSNVYVASNSNQWKFDTTGQLALPTISLSESTDEQTVIRSQRKLIPPLRWSAVIDGTTPTVVYNATSVDTTSMKVTVQIQHQGLGMEFFEVFATFTGADTYYTVSNRVAPPTIDASTVVVGLGAGNTMKITVTINSGAGTSWVTYDAVEFGIPND